MASTFYGLNIAYSGVNVYQTALNITGHNISNVETEGYCRQYVEQAAGTPLRTYTDSGMIGSGVVANGVSQMRNLYYDYKYWSNSAKYGEAETQKYYLLQIENYFTGNTTADIGSVSEGDDFSALFSSMFNALDEVAKSPADAAIRNNFISTTQSMADYFNAVYYNLQSLQEDCNLEIQSKASEINSIAEQIANINKQINVIEGTGSAANDLRDKRAVLIDQLSEIATVTVEEIPIVDSNNPDRNTGMYTYGVKIAGQTLVEGYRYNTLLVKPRAVEDAVNQTDLVGLYDLEWSNGLEFNPTNELLGGQLRALFDVRDGNNKENFQGTISSVDMDANTLTIPKDSVLGVYKEVYGVNIPERGTITIKNCDMSYDSFSINEDGSYTFHLTESECSVMPGMVGGKVSVGDSVDYMGIPYYMSQLNEFVRKFAETFNKIHSGNEDLNGNKVGNFFTGIDPVDGTELQLDELPATGTDSYYRLTAGNFTVMDVYMKDPTRLATTGQITEGVEQSDVLAKLAAIKDQNNFYNGGSAGEFLECIITDIALDTKTATTMSEKYDNIGKTIEQQRLSVSGVDNDEEALNLVKYQNAYNLSAKMMSIMAEIYDRLILQTGV